jgi:predicted methyltransferase
MALFGGSAAAQRRGVNDRGIQMNRLHYIIAALALSTVPFASLTAAPADVGSAIALPSRSADNVKLDEGRKPAELLRFLGLEQGMTVIDMFGANRYWAEITAPAVGPAGKIYVWQPTQFYDDKTKAAFAEFNSKASNVSIVATPFEAPQLPANYADFMLINLDYHDVYWENAKFGVKRMEPEPFVKAVYGAMKPGGVVGVVDHAAVAGGDTRQVVDKLHRIHPEVVKADFKRAGFVLEAESDLYRNPADDHSLLVFDPKIRGKTDRFVLKFRKPR